MSTAMDLHDIIYPRVKPYGGPGLVGASSEAARQILAAGYRKPRTITTPEGRQALPDMSVVRTAAGTIANIFAGRAYFFNTELTSPVTVLALPIVVLHEPGPTNHQTGTP